MIATTYSGSPLLVVNDAPDWSGNVSASFELAAQWEESLTRREARRPVGATLRTRLRYRATLDASTSQATAQIVSAYQRGDAVTPFWPLAVAWAARASIPASGLFVAWTEGWASWALASSPTGFGSTFDYVAPALWGYIDDPGLDWVSPAVATLDVDFVEAGAAANAIAPNAVTFSAGPGLSGYATAPRLVPFQVLLSESQPEAFRLNWIEERLGFSRSPLFTLYPQTARLESDFVAYASSQAEAWSMLAFFAQHGTGATFWAPSWRQAVTLAADLAGGSTSLSVVSSGGILAGDYLAFVTGVTVSAAARVSTIAGTTLTLATAPGAFAAAHTVAAPLVLARLDKPRIEITWTNWQLAQARVSIVEVPAEYAPAADETLGTTLGLLGTRAWLYDITQTIGGVTTTTRRTSYEANVTVGGNTYTAVKMDHGPIRQGLFIDRDELDIRSEIIPGDPLVRMAVGQSEAPVSITVSTCNVSGGTGSGVVTLFTGDVTSVSVRGSRLTAKATTAGSVFDRMFPRFRLQPGCNHALFSTGCGLASANWRFTATLTNPGTPGYPFTFDLGSLARAIGTMPTITAGWFAGGWIEFGAGASMVRRAILDSTAPVSGALTVTLARDPSPFPSVGASVALYPGCDGAFATCSAKFANQLNFGGHPFMPPSNPSLVKLSASLGGGKK